MSIPVTCTCGQQFMAQPHLAGQRVACPNCGNPLTIPPSTEQATATIEEVPASNIVSCQCGQSFKAPPHLAGKRVPCPSCGQPIDIPGGTNGGGSEPRSPAASASPAKKSAGATPRKRSAVAAPPVEMPAEVEGLSEVDAGLGWDDALAGPIGAVPLDAFGTGPAYVPRRVEAEPIQPMTMYAIWIGGGAVVLLILLILGHIIWKAFSNREGAPASPAQPTESAPVEPAPVESAPADPTPPAEETDV